MSLFLPVNAQRSILERSNFRTIELSRSGMTLIELLASLSLFVVILGILMTVLNSATDMWTNSRGQKRELTVAENIADLIADDLYQAVTDNGVPANSTSVPIQPCFILWSPTNDTSKNVVTMLGFARHASLRTYSNDNTAGRLSLDAVFYTFYNYALFRHVIPLSYTSFNDPETLGELLETQRANVENQTLHDTILAAVKNPTAEDPAPWSCLLLAERVQPVVLATLPETYVRKDSAYNQISKAQQTAAGLWLPPQYDRLAADVLPDRIDISLHLFDKQEWPIYLELENKEKLSDEDRTRLRHLGLLHSKRINLPAQGGSRLP